MTPNYEDFSCQFSFGKTPLAPQLDEVFAVSCFTQCPSKAAHRRLCHKIDLEIEPLAATEATDN
jgi:Beta-carotene isomerase D27-like, C-terminal